MGFNVLLAFGAGGVCGAEGRLLELGSAVGALYYGVGGAAGLEKLLKMIIFSCCHGI